METKSLVLLIILILLAITLFLLAREVACWYFKINKRLELQEETNKLLKEIIEQNKRNANNKDATKS